MSCELCGKKIKTGEDFILQGKYPRHRARATVSGEIYHKTCFMENLKKEIKDK